MLDFKLTPGDVFAEQAEVIIDGVLFSAVAFTIAGSNSLAVHPGDAVGALAALSTAASLHLRSGGAGIDTGPIALDLPGDALAWLIQCGKQFHIAIDRPTDANAPPLPTPRPRSPGSRRRSPRQPGRPASRSNGKSPAGMLPELRGNDGKILACIIRQHYGAASRLLGAFLIVSRINELTMMLKDSSLNLPGNAAVTSTLTIDNAPFAGFKSHVLGNDEIGIFPQHRRCSGRGAR